MHADHHNCVSLFIISTMKQPSTVVHVYTQFNVLN